MCENSRLTPLKRAESPCLFLLQPNNHTKPPMELSTSTPTIVELEGRFYESHVCLIDTMALTVHEACMHVVLEQISKYPSSVNGMLIYKSEVKELEINDVIRLLHDEAETSYILTTKQAFVTSTSIHAPVIVLADSSTTNLSPNLMLGAELQNLPPKTCIFLHDINSDTLMISNRVLEFPASASNALKNARLDMLQLKHRYQQKDLDVVVHAENNEVIVRHTFLKEHNTSIRYELPDTELLHTDGVLGYCGCKSFSLHKSNTTAAFLQRRDQRGHDSKNASSKRNFCKHILAIIVLHFYSDKELLSFLDDEDVTTCRGSAAKKLRK
jgi:hypothetical protein